MSFPFDLDLSRFVPGTQAKSHYELFSVLVHAGSAGSDHYTAFVRTSPTRLWYQSSDSVVAEASVDQAVMQSFGGSSMRTAFALVYVRKSEIPRIFQEVELPDRIRGFVS